MELSNIRTCRKTNVSYIMHLFIFLTILPYIRGEVFTSMADMEEIVLSEKKMITELNVYIKAEENKLKHVKDFMSRLDGVLKNVNASEDIGVYLGNPINSYLMLKRFNIDWRNVERMLQVDLAEDFNTVFENYKPYFPTTEDHKGAIDALLRLQNVYKLQARSLANGVVPGQFRTQPLNVKDTYELGVRAYQKNDWEHAAQWLSIALDGLNNQDNNEDNIDRSEVIDHLAFAFYRDGKLRKAYQLTRELSMLRPNDERLLNNIETIESEMKSSQYGDVGDELHETRKEEKLSEREQTKKNYAKLCRGEMRAMTRKEKRRLKCWYRKKHPLLRLKPQKVERLWVKPEVLLFRDIITDQQIDWIKQTAYPRLQRAVIQDPLTDELKVADYRISKSAWLSANDYKEVRHLAKRADAATGLDMNFAEHLQIADYGLGGQYEPHFDHATGTEDKFTSLDMGNRIATLLFYLSDVQAGGATVFTSALATVYPSKNDAVFWFNLKRSGESNVLTKHAGCPVLVGHKLISNWWIHENGQEFRRPCALNKDW